MPLRDINSVLKTHAAGLMAIDGVTAVAVGALADGKPCIRVYVVKKTGELARWIPGTLGGYPVDVEVSGVIRPLPGETE